MSCSSNSPPPIYYQDPDASLWYGVDWSDYLAEQDDDTIATSEWILPDGIDLEDVSNTTTVAKIKLSGGTEGASYDIVNRIVTTTLAETEDRTIRIVIEER
jgi:hypothetical protein